MASALMFFCFWALYCVGCVTYYEVEEVYRQNPHLSERGVVFPDSSEHVPNPQAIQEIKNGTRQVANAAWWGFDPHDSTEALQQAFDSGATIVHIPNMDGRPWNTHSLVLRSNQEIIIERGTIIQAKRGAFHGAGDSLIVGNNIENVTIRGYGVTVRMWREDYYSPAYSFSEGRFMFLLLATNNITLEGLLLEGSGGDGIFLATARDIGTHIPNRNIHIKNMVISNHPRQAISVENAENLLIEGSWMLNTRGYFPFPQAGIDFEPVFPEERLVNCIVRDSFIIGNAGPGILVSLQNLNEHSLPVSITVERTIIERNGLFGLYFLKPNPLVRGTIELRNNQIRGLRFFPEHPAFKVIQTSGGL